MPCGDLSFLATTAIPNVDYPRVHADGRAVFRLVAPEARGVHLMLAGGDRDLGEGPFPMIRDEAGAWELTVTPAAPGFHYYWFIVDCLQVNDPGSETFFGYGRLCSGIEIPEAADVAAYYLPQDVAHGEVRARWYLSSVTGQWRRAFIYTPPGYDADCSGRYPVLYLQHGGGEDARGWPTQGHMSHIMDNLLAAGAIAPMLVAMDSGQVLPRLPGGLPSREGQLANAHAFGRVVLEDLVPLVDTTFRTRADCWERALAGLSMGGMQTLVIGLAHPETFASLGVFSGAPFGGLNLVSDYDGALADAAAVNARMRLLWMGAGTAEPSARDRTIAISAALTAVGIGHTVYWSPDTAHEWLTWRRCLREFAAALFR
jgi:enterochelin esterase-like enzyme